MSKQMFDFLAPQRLTEVVDIGANPIGSTPPYASMLAAGLCRVTGFEPHEEAYLDLQKKKGLNEQYLPYAVGDGETHTLNLYKASVMTSLFEPNLASFELFDYLKPFAEIDRRVPIKTHRLDDISEIRHIDFLKIDIQGGELAVFKNGANQLAEAVVVQAEVSFVPLYINQPCIGHIDLEMRKQGFIPHCFASMDKRPIAPCMVNNDPHQAVNQLLEADIVYVRDFSHPELLSDEQLKQIALIVQQCYGSFDLAMRCVMILEHRQALKPGALQEFVEILSAN